MEGRENIVPIAYIFVWIVVYNYKFVIFLWSESIEHENTTIESLTN